MKVDPGRNDWIFILLSYNLVKSMKQFVFVDVYRSNMESFPTVNAITEDKYSLYPVEFMIISLIQMNIVIFPSYLCCIIQEKVNYFLVLQKENMNSCSYCYKSS